jgi:hypothetical protein
MTEETFKEAAQLRSTINWLKQYRPIGISKIEVQIQSDSSLTLFYKEKSNLKSSFLSEVDRRGLLNDFEDLFSNIDTITMTLLQKEFDSKIAILEKEFAGLG